MAKIALCLSGQPRSFEKGYEYHKRNLLDHHDVDVFIHTWECDGLEEYARLYNPVAMMIEKPLVGNFDEQYTNTPNAERHPPRFTVAMLHSIYKSCELKTTHELTSRTVS